MRVLLYFGSLLLFGCASTPDPIGVATQNDVTGKWDIVRFDNYKPNRISGDGKLNAYVVFGDTGTGYHIGCNFTGNSAIVNDDGYLVPVPTDLENFQTLKGCGRVFEKRDDIFFDMMNSSPLVEIISDGRLRLSTKKHELILERAHIGQMRNAVQSLRSISKKWRIATVNRGGRGWGGSSYAKRPLSISANYIRYGDCSPYIATPIIEEDGQIKGDLVQINDAISCVNPTDAEEVILELLSLGPIAEPARRGDFVLSHKNLRVVLTRRKNW